MQSRLILLYAIMLGSTLINGVKLPLVHVAPYNLVLPVCSVLIIFLQRRHAEEVWMRHKPIIITWSVLWAYVFVSAFLSPFQAVSLKYSVKYAQFYIVFLALIFYVHDRRILIPTYRFIYWFMAALAVAAILDAFLHAPLLPLLRIFRPSDSLAVYPRASGLMTWPNQVGVLLGMSVVLGFILRKEDRIGRGSLALGTALVLVAICLTASRNAWLTLLCGLGLGWYFFPPYRRKIVLVGAIWVAAMMIIPVSAYRLGLLGPQPLPDSGVDPYVSMGNPLAAVFWRMERWARALQLWYQHPITGLGWMGFATAWGRETGTQGHNAHNLFLCILSDFGLIGLFLCSLLFFFLARRVPWTNPLATIPVVLLLVGQVIDSFVYDFTFMAIVVFILASLTSLKVESVE